MCFAARLRETNKYSNTHLPHANSNSMAVHTYIIYYVRRDVCDESESESETEKLYFAVLNTPNYTLHIRNEFLCANSLCAVVRFPSILCLMCSCQGHRRHSYLALIIIIHNNTLHMYLPIFVLFLCPMQFVSFTPLYSSLWCGSAILVSFASIKVR